MNGLFFPVSHIFSSCLITEFLHIVWCLKAMRTSWHTERVMALTPPTERKVQAHGTVTMLHFKY